jgi:cbb3-type cytochrome oxidase subunit 3
VEFTGLKLMSDFIFIAVMALFFVGSELYALWCEKL